jgi:peptidoglycan/xylan/chitin deacetylase (PgdA/CDA1 family)
VNSVKRLARRSVKVVASEVDRLRAPVPGVVVLLYHRVGSGSGLDVDLDLAVFDEQMARLRATRRIVSLPEALERLEVNDPTAQAPSIAVTFDDGTADFADTAMPVLERHRIPVTLYIATDFIDRHESFPDDGHPLSWSALADVHTTGLVNIGSHTHRHRLLDRVNEEIACEELDRSIELTSDRIGVRPADFAYPKAVGPSPGADRAVRARFRSAALAGTRSNPYGATDVYRLARSPIQASDGMRWFAHKLAGGMAFEDTLRRSLNQVRYSRSRT